MDNMGESMDKLIKAIKHYQDSLERHTKSGNSEKLLHAIEKLARLPIKVCHLEETGVGRTVNGLKKFEGPVGENARTLVDKWKSMVKGEEEEEQARERARVERERQLPKNIGNELVEDEPDPESLQIIDQVENDESANLETNNSSPKKSNSSNKNSHNSRHSDRDKRSRSWDKKSKRQRPAEDNDNHSDSDSENRSKKHKSDESAKSSSRKRHSDESESSSGSDDSDSSRESSPRRTKHKRKSRRSSSESSDETSSDSDQTSSEDSSSEKDSKHEKLKSSLKKHKQSHSSTSESDSDAKSTEKHTEKSSKHRKSGAESDMKSKEKHPPKEHSSKSQDKSKSKSDKRNKDSDSSLKRDSSSSKSKSKSEHESKHRKDDSTEKEKSKSHNEKRSAKYDDNKKEESRKEMKESSKSIGEKENSKHSRDKKSSREPSTDRKAKRHKGDYANSKDSKSKNPELTSPSNKVEKHKTGDAKKDKVRKDRSETENTKKAVLDPNNKPSKEKNKPNTQSKSAKKLLDGIDSGSGTSFADVLGMLEAPPVYNKSKKKNEEKINPDKSSSGSKERPSKSKSSGPEPSNTFNEADEVPKLLKDAGNLEPLDINMSSLLPSITPNYRPLSMPLDVHNRKMWTDDEALTRVITAKHQRTKVYSGNKCVYTKVPTLFDICSRILQDNLDALEYTGGVPYSILKHILEKANPDQLYQLEFHNPYLIEDTDELWQLHCQKEFRNRKREELESWREMYLRCLDEREAKLKALTANIKQSQDKSLPVRQTKLAYVDSVVKPPRSIARKQAKNGTAVDIKRPSQTPSERLSQLAKSGDAAKVAVPNPGRAAADRSTSSCSGHSSHIKPKKAPLMAKTLSLLKNRFGRR